MYAHLIQTTQKETKTKMVLIETWHLAPLLASLPTRYTRHSPETQKYDDFFFRMGNKSSPVHRRWALLPAGMNLFLVWFWCRNTFCYEANQRGWKGHYKIPIILRETQVFQECILAEQFPFKRLNSIPYDGSMWLVNIYLRRWLIFMVNL